LAIAHHSDGQRKALARETARVLLIPRPVVRQPLGDCEWLSHYLPQVFYHPWTDSRRMLVEEIGRCLRYGTRKCVAAPRGDGKSTVTKYLALKYALDREVHFSLLLAATGGKANGVLADIKRQLRNVANDKLRSAYPVETHVARYVGTAPSKANNCVAAVLEDVLESSGLSLAELNRLSTKERQSLAMECSQSVRVEWKQDVIVLPHWEHDERSGSILMALGITSDGVQGCNHNDIRPSFVMLDDLDSRDSLAAVDGKIAGKIETIIDHTVAGLGGPGRRLGQVMLCTIPSRNSVAFRYSDPQEKPAWSGVRVPRIKRWPTHRTMWDEYLHKRQHGKKTFGQDGKPIDPHGREAFRYYRDNRAEMDAGAELSNEYDYESDELPDGTPKHLSALQKCFDYIADNGMDSFLTEHQNDPPEPESSADKLHLSAYHVQHNCLSGLDRRLVPDGSALVTCGADVQKRGLHWVVVAWSNEGSGCVIDYDFYEFATSGKDAADCELAILDGLWAWHEMLEANPYTTADGEVHDIGLALIDMGWKDESWATQPVQRFCSQLGYKTFMPSKGTPSYRRPKASQGMVVGENWHCQFPDPFVAMNSDHWKLKVHEGYLLERGKPGSLSLFNHPSVDGRPNRNYHLSYAKHILAESWETKLAPGFKRPETKWWHYGKPNHYFDATYQAIVARSVRGLNVLSAAHEPTTHETKTTEASKPPPVTQERQTERRRMTFRR
jgi:hypothetical protein